MLRGVGLTPTTLDLRQLPQGKHYTFQEFLDAHAQLAKVGGLLWVLGVLIGEPFEGEGDCGSAVCAAQVV